MEGYGGGGPDLAPQDVRDLRNQLYEIERDQMSALREASFRSEAEELRKKIKAHGKKPCA